MKKSILKTSIFLITVLLIMTLVFSGCTQNEDEEQPKEVKLGAVNWAEGIAMTNLAKAVLTEKMGYEVEVTIADVAPIFTSIESGDYDAFMDTWLPVTHQTYMEQYGDDVVDLGYNYEGARIGLVVPTYVEIDSIEEMNANADKFDGTIVGIDAGAGIMGATENAIDTYGLDLELMASSGPMMTAALKRAIDNEEWVAVTGWQPHWKFAKWDLKFLEDPEGVYGAVENIHTIARVGLEEDMPEVASFLENFYMEGQELGDLMGQIAESEDEDPYEVAKAWMNDNEELINSWIE